MLKVIQGDRPGRPIPGLSETLWNLLVATWVEQYAQKPQERPSASTVLARLKECVGDWGKSIIPLIPEDWKDIGWYVLGWLWQFVHVLFQVLTMTPQSRQVIFIIGSVILLFTKNLNDLIRS